MNVQQPNEKNSTSPRRRYVFVKNKEPVRVLTAEEANVSSHRLSRPSKYGSSPCYLKCETAEEYATRFFAENPSAEIDKRDPFEKLDSINTYLAEGVSNHDERFSLLVQKKALVLMTYGENTEELFEAYVQLGAYYNDQNNSSSAIRHFKKAQRISSSIKIGDSLMLMYATEYALAILNQNVSTKEEYNKQIDIADSIISDYTDTICNDLNVSYKRSFILARINISRGENEEAITYYGDAIAFYERITKGETNLITAHLYHELGTAHEMNDDIESAKEAYSSAMDIYQSLDVTEMVQELEEWFEEHSK